MNPPEKPVAPASMETGETPQAGVYSNVVMIRHSPFEFLFDFGRTVPEAERIQLAARVVMSPQHAKALLESLRDNIAKYEQQFGLINLKFDAPPTGAIGFAPPVEKK